jgi:outer membrane protein assembly factor BamB
MTPARSRPTLAIHLTSIQFPMARHARKSSGPGKRRQVSTGCWTRLLATGVNIIQAVPSCLGSEGLFATGAVNKGVVFVNGVNCKIPSKPPFLPPTGAVVALKSDGSQKLWTYTSFFAPVLSGVAVANGVVYFNASGLFSILYALDAETGRVLAGVLTSGGISGPSVSKGQIYVGTGTKFASNVPTPTGIVAIGLPSGSGPRPF